MSRFRGRSVRALAVVPVVLALCSTAGPAAAEDPPFVGWTAALPALPAQHDKMSTDDCVAGRAPCVDKAIRDMERRFDPLAQQCAHAAVFSLAYLRTTEMFLSTTQTPGFYADPAFVNHEAVVFARLYFSAVDAWTEGRRDRVPPAWRVALDASAASRVSGSGDLLLGMNAHVNRDLPFALAKVGLVDEHGRTRKPDHEKINHMLNQVVAPLVEEEAARFDPSIARVSTPYGLGYTALMQQLVAWRESAWRMAEQLVSARDDAERERVAAVVEAIAEANAYAIIAQTAYAPPLTSTAGRDTHCAVALAGAGS